MFIDNVVAQIANNDTSVKLGLFILALFLTAGCGFGIWRVLQLAWPRLPQNPFVETLASDKTQTELSAYELNLFAHPPNSEGEFSLSALLGQHELVTLLATPQPSARVDLPPQFFVPAPPPPRRLLRQTVEIHPTKRLRSMGYAALPSAAPTPGTGTPVEEPETPKAPYTFRCVEGALAGLAWPIEQSRFVISGLAITGTIKVDNNTVSAPHACVEVDTDGTIFVSDLGSINGTHIDGADIRGRRVPVKVNNTSLQIGEVRFSIDVSSSTLTERSHNRHRGVHVLQRPGRYLISRETMPVITLNPPGVAPDNYQYNGQSGVRYDARIKSPHAVVSLDRRCEIRDLTWEGGIRINDVAAGKRRIFEYNQHRIQLGDSVFTTSIAGMTQGDNWVIDRFVVQHPIKQGGMAEVYKVEDKDGQIYALKMPHPEKLQELEFKRFWRREQRFMGQLNHPRIVRAHSFGFYKREIPYMVMDYIDGCSLYDILKTVRQPFSWQEALAIITDVTEGLRYVHSKGIAHCDIKPANVLINNKGEVFISDFGIAVEIGDLSTDMGTLSYIAPELLRSDRHTPVTETCDIYSLGAVFYELLTGQRLTKQSDPLLLYTSANPGDNLFETNLVNLDEKLKNLQSPPTRTELEDTQKKFMSNLQKTFTRVANPLELAMGEAVPQFIKDIVIKCTEHLPENRYRNCQPLYQDLTGYSDADFDRSELRQRVSQVVAPK